MQRSGVESQKQTNLSYRAEIKVCSFYSVMRTESASKHFVFLSLFR